MYAPNTVNCKKLCVYKTSEADEPKPNWVLNLKNGNYSLETKHALSSIYDGFLRLTEWNIIAGLVLYWCNLPGWRFNGDLQLSKLLALNVFRILTKVMWIYSRMLKRKHKISSVTIQMEEYQDEVAKSCNSCSTTLQ